VEPVVVMVYCPVPLDTMGGGLLPTKEEEDAEFRSITVRPKVQLDGTEEEGGGAPANLGCSLEGTGAPKVVKVPEPFEPR